MTARKPFKFGDVTIEVGYLGIEREPHYHRQYDVVVLDRAMKDVLFTFWMGKPLGISPSMDEEAVEVAENVLETLYMATTPEDFRPATHTQTRKVFIDAATDLGEPVLIRAYTDVIDKREYRQRSPGPKDWKPKPPKR